MTFNSILDGIIATANDNYEATLALLNSLKSETIETGDEDTPAPTVDSNNVWTLTQDTADSNGIYKGLYSFALNTACSYLYIQSVTGHTTPANTSFPPARYTDCADVVHDLASVNDLDGKQVKSFEILSDTAFSVSLTVTATWSHTFDFTVSDGGWITNTSGLVSGVKGSWVSGQGWNASNFTITGNVRQRAIWIQKSFVSATITRMTMTFNLTKGSYGSPTNTALSMTFTTDTPNSAAVNGSSQLRDSGEVEQTRTSLHAIVCSSTTTGGVWNGDGRITSITVEGTGINPFI